MGFRKYIMAATLLLAFGGTAMAQKNKLTLELGTHISAYDKEFAPIGLRADWGYGIADWLTVGFRLEDVVSLVELDDVKTYDQNATSGLFARFNVLKFDSNVLSVKAVGGTSLTNDDWKFVYYDCAVRLERVVKRWNFGCGIGARYYDSRNDVLGNKFRVYMDIGVGMVL